MTEAHEASYFLQSQCVTVERVIASGEQVAVEGVWAGVLKVELGPLKEGAELRAYVAFFFTLRDGKITALRNHYTFDLPTT